jgi:hypothetical protein
MKYLGVISTSNSVYPILFQLNSNTHIDFDTKNQNLVLTIDTSIPYIDSNFKNYYGKWIHIGIASYVSDNINVFPHKFIWSVNNIDIPHAIDFTLPINGIQISSLSFGEECIVFYTIILHIYSKFIKGI